jgi:hypothetical protein
MVSKKNRASTLHINKKVMIQSTNGSCSVNFDNTSASGETFLTIFILRDTWSARKYRASAITDKGSNNQIN